MPCGSLDLKAASEPQLMAARKAWTSAAFQEHRTGVACCTTLRALMEARAPLDLIALAARFPLDELVHVELCARMAMELGGGTEDLVRPDARRGRHERRSRTAIARLRARGLRYFCVGEALSIPLLRGTWRRKPVIRCRARCSGTNPVRDEAAHGTFGFTFLDWALPQLDASALPLLGRAADSAIAGVRQLWAELARQPVREACEIDALAFMETDAYLALAAKAMDEKVLPTHAARTPASCAPGFPHGAQGVQRTSAR